MADIRYDIGQLFQAAFGINSPIYITEPFLRQAPPHFDWSGVDVLPALEEQVNETELPQSWMGTPIVFEAAFVGEAESYLRYKLNGELEEVELPDMVFPAATMFSFRRSKNITRTNVLGSNGTVKEIYGFDDWIVLAASRENIAPAIGSIITMGKTGRCFKNKRFTFSEDGYFSGGDGRFCV